MRSRRMMVGWRNSPQSIDSASSPRAFLKLRKLLSEYQPRRWQIHVRPYLLLTFSSVTFLIVAFLQCPLAFSQTPSSAPSGTKSAANPKLVDITDSTKVDFTHISAPDQRYIMESMSGGVALIDYDRDGWPDIYFTNAQSVDMALHGVKSRSALFHNNHDGTFTDVTDKAGVGFPCWANGVSVGDYNND